MTTCTKLESFEVYLRRRVKEINPQLRLKIKRKERIRPCSRRLWYGGAECAGTDYYISGRIGFFGINEKILKIIYEYGYEADGGMIETAGRAAVIHNERLAGIIREALKGSSWAI